MDDKELYERGLKLRVEMFGREAVDKRRAAAAATKGAPGAVSAAYLFATLNRAAG